MSTTATADAKGLAAPTGTGPARATASAEVVLRDGTPARIWPLLPTDGRALRAGFRTLSADSRRRRFLTAAGELTDRMLHQLVDGVDGERHIALVLLAFPARGVEEPVGVGRLVQDATDPATADIAVTVADSWQGRGVGASLARALLDRRPGAVRRLSTVVAADNAASLGLLRSLGRMSVRPAGSEVVEVSVALGPNSVRGS